MHSKYMLIFIALVIVLDSVCYERTLQPKSVDDCWLKFQGTALFWFKFSHKFEIFSGDAKISSRIKARFLLFWEGILKPRQHLNLGDADCAFLGLSSHFEVM